MSVIVSTPAALSGLPGLDLVDVRGEPPQHVAGRVRGVPAQRQPQDVFGQRAAQVVQGALHAGGDQTLVGQSTEPSQQRDQHQTGHDDRQRGQPTARVPARRKKSNHRAQSGEPAAMRMERELDRAPPTVRAADDHWADCLVGMLGDLPHQRVRTRRPAATDRYDALADAQVRRAGRIVSHGGDGQSLGRVGQVSRQRDAQAALRFGAVHPVGQRLVLGEDDLEQRHDRRDAERIRHAHTQRGDQADDQRSAVRAQVAQRAAKARHPACLGRRRGHRRL
jgi:hypothetical protein